jgi:hypothetical protein
MFELIMSPLTHPIIMIVIFNRKVMSDTKSLIQSSTVWSACLLSISTNLSVIHFKLYLKQRNVLFIAADQIIIHALLFRYVSKF